MKGAVPVEVGSTLARMLDKYLPTLGIREAKAAGLGEVQSNG